MGFNSKAPRGEKLFPEDFFYGAIQASQQRTAGVLSFWSLGGRRVPGNRARLRQLPCGLGSSVCILPREVRTERLLANETMGFP